MSTRTPDERFARTCRFPTFRSRLAPAGALAACILAGAASAADPMGASFTYQGRLDVQGEPATGTFDFRFELTFNDAFDSALGVIHHDDVEVVDGLFTVKLEWNSELFNGNERWLVVGVRPGSHPNADHAKGTYTTLGSWESIRPTPFALYAERAGGLELPIDEHVNFLGTPCVKIRNDATIAIAGHSDGAVGLYAETIDGTALLASATGNGWAASFNGKVHVQQALGIGTANLGTLKLAVNGSAAKPGGGSWSTLSDARAKHDVTPLRGALARLLSLRGVTFEYDDAWIEGGLALPGPQMGFIAQEVQEVIPAWVEALPDGTLLITERGATALLVEAIRELEDRRAADERRIAALEARLEALTRALEARPSRP